LPWVLGYSGLIYLIVASLCGLEFFRRSLLIFKKDNGAEKKLFLYSIFYLSVIFTGICLDKLIGLGL
jgi:protoheme IX farnesyltransferase